MSLADAFLRTHTRRQARGTRGADVPWRREWSELAAYNTRVSQGIVHEDSYVRRMRALQDDFDRAHGNHRLPDGTLVLGSTPTTGGPA